MKLQLPRLVFSFLSFAFGTSVLANPEEAVVKVSASIRFPNPLQPWTKGDASQSMGTGVVIDGNRVLTNAHVVGYGTEITVEDRKGGEKFEAKVEALNFDVDLAVLSVADEKFFKKRFLIPSAADLPKVQDPVSIYGFPIGGNDLSVTRGEVSRVEYTYYGRGIGPVIQVNAAVNPGNSGGPALVDGKMVGIVFSRVQNAQNIGSIIPTEEIDRFLAGAKEGKSAYKPLLAVQLIAQTLENKTLRRKLKVDDDVRGVLVQRVGGVESSPLKPFDVITKIGDYPIENTGHIQLKNGMRAPFLYPVPQLARNNEVMLTVWRQGMLVPVVLPVTIRDNRVLRPYDGQPLSYFIHGPLVFAQGKSDDISIYARMTRTMQFDNSPLITRSDDFQRTPDEELVVVSTRMFPHATSKGYSDPAGRVVKDINDTPIKNLRHLVETLRDARDEFLTIRFHDSYSEMMVFDRKAMSAATEEILEDHGIPLGRRGSPDMLKVWRARENEK